MMGVAALYVVVIAVLLVTTLGVPVFVSAARDQHAGRVGDAAAGELAASLLSSLR